MHLKSYQIDGKLLRTGAANFSASGLKRQDNDLIVIERPRRRQASNAICAVCQRRSSVGGGKVTL
jgi:phosphatidylserine/phosphatidylglycerophosphate/cardiolipin synthase-like enzyme